MPRSFPAAIPPKARGKSKGNRSIRCIPGGNEAIWDQELTTALIEGIWVLTANCIPTNFPQHSTSIHQWADNAYGPCMMAAKAIQAWADVNSSSNI
jgi:hypothetical protein